MITINDIIHKTNPELIERSIKAVFGEETFKRITSLKVGLKDIIISTYPKTGTTVIQQICHILRGGDMNFICQYQVSPFIEMAWSVKEEIGTEIKFDQAIYKSHMSLSTLNYLYSSDTKYIVTIRNPEDTIKSYHSFFSKKNIIKEDIEVFIKGKLEKAYGIDMYTQFVENIKSKDLPNVLLIVFEDIINKPEEVIKRIANFMEIKDFDLEKVKEMSSKEFMLKHQEKFTDEHHYRVLQENGKLGIPDRKPAARVTNGEHHQTIVFNDELKEILQMRFREYITNPLGFKDYDELVKSLSE